jgi:putative transposase
MSHGPRPSQFKIKSCERSDEPGKAHALTFSCFRRRPFLSRDGSRRWFVDALDAARRDHHFHVWAYVIMPEHVHVIVYPTEPEYSISDFLSDVKLPVTRKALAHVRRNAPMFLPRMRDRQPNGDVHYRFWQRGGGYDRDLKETQTILNEIDYVHANPVRRGLAATPVDWEWSSARFFIGREDVPLQPDVETIPFGRPRR